MGAIATGFTAAFRDYNTDGQPASGAYKPVKSVIRALGATIESEIVASPRSYDTITALRAVDAAANITNGTIAYVLGRSAAGDCALFAVQWNSTSAATHDNVLVFRPTTGAASTGNGRWLRKNATPTQTFADGDATPSIANGADFVTTGATAITDFDDAFEGQEFTVRRGNADIVLTHDGTKIECGGANVTLSASRPTARFIHAGGIHYLQDNTGAPAATALTLAALKALPKGLVATVSVAGKTTVGDGWGGIFYWDGASSATGDDALVVTPDAGGTGRWRRLIPTGGIVTPEMFGAVRDGSTADTTALQAALNSGFIVALLDGTYLSAGLTLPAGTRIVGTSDAILKKSAATGDFLTISGNDVAIRGITIDGNQVTDTFAGGFTSGHNGIVCSGTSGTPRSDIVVENCTIKNFGHHGIYLTYVTRQWIRNNRITRIGYTGVMLLSPLRAWVSDNEVENIYPGNGGSSPHLNAYGISATCSTPSGRAPEYVQITNNHIKDVPSWEAIDIHFGKRCLVQGNTIEGCSQGIAIECGVTGYTGSRINILGNVIIGWSGATRSKDSQTYYKNGGIICVGGITNEISANLNISGNTLEQMGDSRTSASAAAIYVQNWRNVVIANNSITDAYCRGIRLDHLGTSSGGLFYANVHGNVIDGVITANSICQGISASIRALGHARANYVNGLDAGTSYYVQDATPTYVLVFDPTNLDDLNALSSRAKLTANRTYYVRTDGSDSNSGLLNTAGGAFLTIQKAIDVASQLDMGGFDVTIQIANGTWTQALTLKSHAGEGKIILLGDEGTLTNVTISTTSASCITATEISGRYAIRGLRLQTTTSGSGIIATGNRVDIEFQNCNFGAIVDHGISASNGAAIKATGHYTISGGGATHWNILIGATLAVQGRTITITGTPAFSTAFCAAARGAICTVNGNTFSGSATGVRYDAITNAVIFTSGGGATYLPGGTSGTTATGGQYV